MMCGCQQKPLFATGQMILHVFAMSCGQMWLLMNDNFHFGFNVKGRESSLDLFTVYACCHCSLAYLNKSYTKDIGHAIYHERPAAAVT